jgi:hypothetical protein
LKRRVRAVELISSFPWGSVSLQTGNANTEKQAYHLEGLLNSPAGGVRFREFCLRYEVDIRLLLG